MNGKKGISSVVATVLIILITVAAVSIVFVFVLPMIRMDVGNFDPNVNFQVFGLGESTIYHSSSKVLSLSVSRGIDKLDIENIKIIVFDSGNSFSKMVEPPKINGVKNYLFNFSSCSFEPESVSISYIYPGESKKESLSSKEVEIPVTGDFSNEEEVVSFC